MKKITVLFSCCLLCIQAICQKTATSIAVIPEPVQMVQNAGSFILPNIITIESPDLPALKTTNDFLQQRLSLSTGYGITAIDVAVFWQMA